MKQTRMVQSLLPDGSVQSLTLEITDSPPYKLALYGMPLERHEFSGEDLFDALVDLRNELEKMGVRLLCAGARIDVFPSGMSRSMGGARKAYIMQLGVPATETVDIFESAEDTSIGSVREQAEFHKKWTQSLIQ